MKKSKKRLIRNFAVIGAVIILMAVTLSFSISILNIIRQRMNDSATTNLLNTTKVIRESMENHLEKDLESLAVVGNFHKNNDYMDEDHINDLCSTMGFDWLVVADENGQGVGYWKDIFKVEDLTRYEDWTPETRGYSNLYIGSTGRPQIALWSPIYRNNEYIGTAFGGVILNKYYSANIFTFYNGEGRTYIFDGNDGSWILKSLGSDGTTQQSANIYSLLKNSDNNDDDIELFRQAISERKAGTAEFKFNSEKSFLCFLPVHSSDSWYIATVISRTDLLSESTEVQKMITLTLAISCVTLALIAIGLSFWVSKKTKADQVRYRDSLFSNISANLDSTFLIYENDGTLVFISNNIKRLLGINKSWLEENPNRLFDWCNIDKDDPVRTEFLSGNLKYPIVKEVNAASDLGDKMRTVRLELIPAADYGQKIAVLTDITKEKEIQNSLIDAMNRAEQASTAKNDFLSAMSHDLRTPINGIVGMTTIAAANINDTRKVGDCLTKISDSTNTLLGLINEVLDMSQIESGKMQLNNRPLNIAQMFKSVVSMMYTGIEKKNHKVTVRIENMKHEDVFADSSRLTRIATNLISNAVKYTPEGGSIELTLKELPSLIKGYGCYELTVSDNGIGMSEDFLKKLYTPFERENDNKYGYIQGTGLGMSIVKNIASLMMGNVVVESQKGKGTTVRVSVNLMFNEQKAEQDSRLNGLSVLVVGNDSANCQTISGILTEIGMKAEWTNDPNKAVALSVDRHESNDDFFCVIIDYDISDGQGFEVARQILSNTDGNTFVLIAAQYSVDLFNKDNNVGVHSFLSKPLYKAELINKMNELVSGQNNNAGVNQNEITSGKKVLLAEDNDINREIAVELLSMIGISTDAVTDGIAVVRKFVQSPPKSYDAILMDIQMPEMNGYEATKAIRNSSHPEAKTIPIIALTADAFNKDICLAQEAGMNDHITKPFSSDTLISVLKKYLNAKREDF